MRVLIHPLDQPVLAEPAAMPWRSGGRNRSYRAGAPTGLSGCIVDSSDFCIDSSRIRKRWPGRHGRAVIAMQLAAESRYFPRYAQRNSSGSELRYERLATGEQIVRAFFAGCFRDCPLTTQNQRFVVEQRKRCLFRGARGAVTLLHSLAGSIRPAIGRD